MSALRPDVTTVACPRCDHVMEADEVGEDLRCVNCARVLPPSHLPPSLVPEAALGTALPEGRRPTREAKAITPGRRTGAHAALTTPSNTNRAVEEQQTRIGPLPGPPTVNDTLPVPTGLRPGAGAWPEDDGDAAGASDRTMLSRAPLPPAPSEPQTQPVRTPPPPAVRRSAERQRLTPSATAPQKASARTPPPPFDGVGRTTDLEPLVQNAALRSGPSHPDVTPPEALPQDAGASHAELAAGMRLGGYDLVRRIGTGGMGTVWLARQLSLDRHVALKLLHGEMAVDPSFVVRFNREAVAAGQLVHHNIVQIYDTGADKGAHFFSMEFVDGETLGQLVRREGRLDPEVAAGYILQAARGLHYAHQQGMVHRDVKPDNLLLNRHGVVKLADLGLVKLRGALLRRSGTGEATARAEFSMGTPAYIAPEQVQDPAGVDQRADVYSLGCTLYELLTGRPPFEGDSVAVVLTKHVYDAPVPAQDLAKRVPPALAEIVSRMMAKSLDERFGSMIAVIRDLERYLGFDGSSAFSPREEHADQLERSVDRFNGSIWSRRRGFSLLGVLGAFAVAQGVLGFLALWLWMGVVAGAALVFLWAAFILRGLTQQTALFLRVRQMLLGAPLTSWLVEFLLVGGAGYAIHHYRLHWYALGAAGAGVAAAFLWYVLLDRRVEMERRPQVEEIERMLRSIRLRGLDENALRQFVSKYSGETWEAFYEALFGYDALIAARAKWGRNDRGLPRKRHATWRDPLIRFIDSLQQARKDRAVRRLQRKLERRRLKAEHGALDRASSSTR